MLLLINNLEYRDSSIMQAQNRTSARTAGAKRSTLAPGLAQRQTPTSCRRSVRAALTRRSH